MAASPSKPAASFAAFFLVWARRQRWQVPAFHWRMVAWLDDCRDPVRVLMVFRGAAKSTLYAVYKAYRLWCDRGHRSLVWSTDTKLAKKMTRDVLNVLRNHPWCRGMLPPVNGTEEFWINGASDARNPSMAAFGVLSNATGGRADDIDFDDVEVPKNIRTAEAREKLRERISESTFIIVPGGQKTYIGTPHTHDSIYPEQIAGGAAMLKIPLFEHAWRIEDGAGQQRISVPFDAQSDGYYVMVGIGKFAQLLVDGRDYETAGRTIKLLKEHSGVIDVYTGCAWPERFTRADLDRRRKDTRTLNAWDSQYMLEAKPIQQVRLDPDKLIAYDEEPELREVNGTPFLLLGRTRIMSATLRLDPSSGKLRSDKSALCLVLQDQQGNLYWHRALALLGDLAEPDDEGTIRGGQVDKICDVVEQFHLSRIDIETNGIGGHVPSILRGALKRRRIQCGVREEPATGNKNAAILSAIEPPLRSGYLWAHVSVIEAVTNEMREWNPAVIDQPDDYLDAAARAILTEPARIGQRDTGKPDRRKSGGNPPVHRPNDWRPNGGVHEVELDLS